MPTTANKTLKINIPVTAENYAERFLASINGVLNLSSKELTVLATLIKLYDPKLQDVCHKEIRRQVQRDLEFPSKAALNNYIKFLANKSVIIHATSPKSHYTFHPLVQGVISKATQINIVFEPAVGDEQ